MQRLSNLARPTAVAGAGAHNSAWRVLSAAHTHRAYCADGGEPPASDAARGRNDTAHVQRRYGWRAALRAERQAFIRGEGLGAAVDAVKAAEEREARRPKKDPRTATLRAERRYARQLAHLERLDEVAKVKAVRQAAKREIFEARQAADAARRADTLAAVEKAAVGWITEESLDEAVERCVDQFFVGEDALEHATRQM